MKEDSSINKQLCNEWTIILLHCCSNSNGKTTFLFNKLLRAWNVWMLADRKFLEFSSVEVVICDITSVTKYLLLIIILI